MTIVSAMNRRPPAQSANVIVETYPGYKGEPTPRAFIHESIRLEVREIADRWETAQYSFFKVLASDHHCYTLRHHQEDLTWELVMREES